MDRKIDQNQRRGGGGFTLIELVVVVAIMSVLSISVSFSAGRSGTGAQSDAARFAALHARLYERAIMGRHPLAVSLSETGWQMLQPDKDEAQSWVTVGRSGEFRGEARFQFSDRKFGRRTRGELTTPDLVFLPNGQSTPFEVAFITARMTVDCVSDGWTGLICAQK